MVADEPWCHDRPCRPDTSGARPKSGFWGGHMAQALVSNIERDGETRTFQAHGSAAIGNAGGVTVLRGTFEPGWRWSNDGGPSAGTTSCRMRHRGDGISGRMTARS